MNQPLQKTTFEAEHLSPQLSGNNSNSDLEKDIVLTANDVEELESEFFKLESGRLDFKTETEFLAKLNRTERISPKDKQFLITNYHQNPTLDQALFIIYLNSALLDRQISLSDKFLPRYAAVDHDAGQKKTVKDYYDLTRTNLNQMRNINSASYFVTIEKADIAEVKNNLEEFLTLAQENQRKMAEIIPLVMAFPVN